MDTEPPRIVLGVSAAAGATFWGLYSFAAAWRAGQGLQGRDVAHLLINVAMGIVAGVLAAAFLGPALVDLIPVAQLREPHALGFIIGAGAWEVAPFAFRKLRREAKAKFATPKEEGQ